jgi:hypothetical protein
MTSLITHNVGVQIPDTYSWPELETLQQVASEIIKNENDENSKAEAKAKAQAAGYKTNYSTDESSEASDYNYNNNVRQ